ncbi:hypothetical protein C1646_688446 [Rhizophagus diaphanus]|nr:hypothetical protein C1646_688446 [Rhizophagus diaphanus] [Rhizophagus sp. MUCL 43196]
MTIYSNFLLIFFFFWNAHKNFNSIDSHVFVLLFKIKKLCFFYTFEYRKSLNSIR